MKNNILFNKVNFIIHTNDIAYSIEEIAFVMPINTIVYSIEEFSLTDVTTLYIIKICFNIYVDAIVSGRI